MDYDIEDVIKRYDDSRAAKAIWDECLPEINAYGCYIDALNVLTNTKRADALDVKLSRLLSNRERTKGR